MPQIQTEYQLVSHAEWERRTRDWEYKFCILPHKCLETGKWMWLKGAYRGRRYRRYDMDLVLLTDKWMCREEFVKLVLLEMI